MNLSVKLDTENMHPAKDDREKGLKIRKVMEAESVLGEKRKTKRFKINQKNKKKKIS